MDSRPVSCSVRLVESDSISSGRVPSNDWVYGLVILASASAFVSTGEEETTFASSCDTTLIVKWKTTSRFVSRLSGARRTSLLATLSRHPACQWAFVAYTVTSKRPTFVGIPDSVRFVKVV